MQIERTKDAVIIRLSPAVDANELQELLQSFYAMRYKEILDSFEMFQIKLAGSFELMNTDLSNKILFEKKISVLEASNLEEFVARSLYTKFISLFPELKLEASHFIDSLKGDSSKENIRPYPKFGSGKGMFVMKADFDEPLEDFEEYMH